MTSQINQTSTSFRSLSIATSGFCPHRKQIAAKRLPLEFWASCLAPQRSNVGHIKFDHVELIGQPLQSFCVFAAVTAL